MKFSVLMSIYNKEKVEYFNRAMQSIWDDQSVKPTEIILVEDGPLYDELYTAIKEWNDKLDNIFKIIPLEKNVGLGDALNIGINNCNYELVARMDTDDISLPNRFKKQLDIFKSSNIDVCSSWVSEFDTNENNIISYRKLPEQHTEIISYAKKRCPLNHPAVMYKKSIVLSAGSYKKMMWFEDYYLWVRLILNNAQLFNIQEPLVNMRAGFELLERRRGIKYALSEYKLQQQFYSLRFINIFELSRNVTFRFISRVLPKSIVKKIYIFIRK